MLRYFTENHKHQSHGGKWRKSKDIWQDMHWIIDVWWWSAASTPKTSFKFIIKHMFNAGLLHLDVNLGRHLKWVILLYSQVKWRPLENCEASPTPASDTQGSRQRQCASTHGSGSCSLWEAWRSSAGRSVLISRLQICTRPHDRSELSWRPRCGSEEERKKRGITETRSFFVGKY